MSKDISIPITDNQIDEPDRTFRLALGNPVNASLGSQTSATLTIVNDDVPVIGFSQPSVQVKEGTPAFLLVLPPNEVAMTVVLSTPSWQPITVDYATSDGSALDKRDYLATQGTLTFNPGETSKSFLVQIARDSIDEADETFTANLSNPTNSVLAAAAAAVATIIDDDDPPPRRLPLPAQPFLRARGASTSSSVSAHLPSRL